MSLVFSLVRSPYLMVAWPFTGWRVWSCGAGSVSSGLLVSGLVALVIGLAALVGDLVFKNLMGSVTYIIIAILSAILIITGAIRTAKALRIRSATKR